MKKYVNIEENSDRWQIFGQEGNAVFEGLQQDMSEEETEHWINIYSDSPIIIPLDDEKIIYNVLVPNTEKQEEEEEEAKPKVLWKAVREALCTFIPFAQ